MSVLKEVYPLMRRDRQLLTLDGRHGVVRLGTDILPHKLTPAERTVMIAVMNQPYTVVSSMDLFSELHPRYRNPFPVYVHETIRPIMSKLRNALEEIDAELPKTVRTSRKLGYMFIPHLSVMTNYQLDLRSLLVRMTPDQKE